MRPGKVTDAASRTWKDLEGERSKLEAPKGGIEVSAVRMDVDAMGNRAIVPPVCMYVYVCMYMCMCMCMCVYVCIYTWLLHALSSIHACMCDTSETNPRTHV